MADFTSDLQGSKPSFTFLDIDPNMELMSQLLEPSSNVNFQSYMGASDDNFFTQPIPEFPGNLGEIFPGVFQQDQKNVVPVSELNVSVASGNDLHESKKRKEMDLSESSSRNSSPSVSESWTIRRKCGSGGKGKGVKSSQEDKPKEVVHVRAKRGQATDSHSLAERVRRGKINERLRCLQDIVPGCYKTMGMAVMLDEIINYVQSLQNQVEFLSMKLTAASTFYDFNSETDAIDIMQRAKAFEAQKLQKAVKEGCEGVASSQHLPLDQNFGSYPSLPYNT